MPDTPHYRRVLLKISGEALSGTGGVGLSAEAIDRLLTELAAAQETGAQLAVVVGGGNFLRGRDLRDVPAIERTTADSMGMLATVMNALALRDMLRSRGISARAFSAFGLDAHCERFVRNRAIAALEAGDVVLLAGGTGSPFFTTDMCAALRAAELDVEVLLKATKVDGVFDRDPVAHPEATRHDRLTYQEVLADRLGVMDLTAISMCMENEIPIVVFQLTKPGNLARALRGERVGSMVSQRQ